MRISIKEIQLPIGLTIYDLRDRICRYFNKEISDTILVYGHPVLLVKFICYLGYLNPLLGRFIKKYEDRWAYSQYRGFIPLPEESYIEIDRKFAQEIYLKSCWKWTNPGWGELHADLTFDIEKLHEIAKKLTY